MDNFHAALDDCELQDLRFLGLEFTWSNKRERPNMVQERLDRFVCDFRWASMFMDAKVSHLEYWKFDHRLILLNNSPILAVRSYQGRDPKKCFHFEECWLESENCADIIQRVGVCRIMV